MGMDAEVLAIGPWGAFQGDDLDYEVDWYRDSIKTGDEKIICLVAKANTSQQSRDLAAICCTEPWALGRHKIEKVELPFLLISEWIGEFSTVHVARKLQRLMDAGCDLWYRPNG